MPVCFLKGWKKSIIFQEEWKFLADEKAEHRRKRILGAREGRKIYENSAPKDQLLVSRIHGISVLFYKFRHAPAHILLHLFIVFCADEFFMYCMREG